MGGNWVFKHLHHQFSIQFEEINNPRNQCHMNTCRPGFFNESCDKKDFWAVWKPFAERIPICSKKFFLWWKFVFVSENGFFKFSTVVESLQKERLSICFQKTFDGDIFQPLWAAYCITTKRQRTILLFSPHIFLKYFVSWLLKLKLTINLNSPPPRHPPLGQCPKERVFEYEIMICQNFSC